MAIKLNLSSGIRELPEIGNNLLEVRKAEFRTGRGSDKKGTNLYLECVVVGSEPEIVVFQEQSMDEKSAFYITALLEAFGWDFPEEKEARKQALSDVSFDEDDFKGKQAIALIAHEEYAGKDKAVIKGWRRAGSVDVVNA